MKKKSNQLIIMLLIVSIIILSVSIWRLTVNLWIKEALINGNYNTVSSSIKKPNDRYKIIYKLHKKCSGNLECAKNKINKNIIGWIISISLTGLTTIYMISYLLGFKRNILNTLLVLVFGGFIFGLVILGSSIVDSINYKKNQKEKEKEKMIQNAQNKKNY